MADLEPKKIRLMLDTNIYDKLKSDTAVNELLNKLIRDERIELVTTHIQEDELAMAPEITGAKSEKIPTEGFILGVSRLGQASLGDGSGQGLSVDDIKTDKGNHAKDALIATTASYHADYLITEDKRLLKKMNQLPKKCVALDFEGLKNLLASL